MLSYLNDNDKEDSTGSEIPWSSGGSSDQKTGKQEKAILQHIPKKKKLHAILPRQSNLNL